MDPKFDISADGLSVVASNVILHCYMGIGSEKGKATTGWTKFTWEGEGNACPSAVNELREWMGKHPELGWKPGDLKQSAGNPRVWDHDLDRFWIPYAERFVLKDGKVVSSEVVLVRHKDDDGYILTSWKPVELADHSLYGLKRWMEEGEKWAPGKLKPTEEPNVYRHDTTEFWIPGAQGFTYIMRRRIRDGKPILDDWGSFGFADSDKPFPKTLEELKAWMVKNPSKGWRVADLVQDNDNKRVWTHGDNQLYIPDSHEFSFAALAEGDVSIRFINDVTCVNALGAALTVGGKYVVDGEEDGLVRVKDDNGEVKPFLPERFEGPGLKKPWTHRGWLIEKSDRRLGKS